MNRKISIITKSTNERLVGSIWKHTDDAIYVEIYKHIIRVPLDDIFLSYDNDEYLNGYEDLYKDFYEIVTIFIKIFI